MTKNSNLAETIQRLPGRPSPPTLCGMVGARRVKRGEPIPKGWAIVKVGKIWDYITPCSEISGLKGGRKEMWLRHNQEEVFNFFNKHGEVATRNRFCLEADTLVSLLQGRRGVFSPPFTKKDKQEIMIEVLTQDVRDCRRELAELKEVFGRFQQTVAQQVTQKFLVPLLQQGIDLGNESFDINPKPPLLISDLVDTRGTRNILPSKKVLK